MDRDERIKMLLDMQEHPEHYSEQELEQMLHDTEAQELMEATALLKRAMKHDEFTMSGQEIAGEWQRFAATHFAHQVPRRGWLKVAASFIGILLIAGLSFAFYWTTDSRQRTTDDGQRTSMVNGQCPMAADSLIRFVDVRLDSMLSIVGNHYGREVCFRDEAPCELRFTITWNRRQPMATFVGSLGEFDGLKLKEEHDTLFVESVETEKE